jgi:hypothetical protein
MTKIRLKKHNYKESSPHCSNCYIYTAQPLLLGLVLGTVSLFIICRTWLGFSFSAYRFEADDWPVYVNTATCGQSISFCP